MKVTLFVLLLFIFGQLGTTQPKETALKDAGDLYEYLEETKEALKESIEDLTDAQMKFKPAQDAWSIAEIVEHIMITDAEFKKMLEAKIAEGETPERRSEIKMTDDEVLGFITNRSEKVKTSPQFVPESKFKTSDDALEAFKDQWEDITDFLKDQDSDFRNYILDFPFGAMDGHQAMLFMAGHANRHIAQIEEVKLHPEFPSE